MGSTITTAELFKHNKPEAGKVLSTDDLLGGGPQLTSFEEDGQQYNVDYDNGEPIVTQDAPNAKETYYATPQQRASWEKQGPISWTEAAMNRDWQKNIPFMAGLKDVSDNLSVYNAIERNKKDEYEDQATRDKDQETIKDYMLQMEEINVRGQTFGSKVYSGVTDLFPMMVEFGLTAGAYTAGRVGATKIASKAVGKIAEKGAKRMAQKAVIGGVSRGTGVAAQTLAMPNRYVPKAYENMILNNVALTDKGAALMKDAENNPASAIVRAFGDTFIEVGTERAGKVFRAGASKLTSKISPKATKSIKDFMSKLPAGRVSKAFKKGGFDGIIEEMGEEELGRLLRASFNIDDQEGNTFQRIVESFPSLEDRLVELAVFSVPGGVSMASRSVASRLKKRGATEEQVATVNNSLSAIEKDNYIAQEDQRTTEEFDAINIADEMTEESEAVINDQYNLLVEEGQIDPLSPVEDSIDQYKEVERAISRQKSADSAMEALSEEEGSMPTDEQAQNVVVDKAQLISDATAPTQKKKQTKIGKVLNPIKAFVRRMVSAEALRSYGAVGNTIYEKVLASDKWSSATAAQAIYKFDKALKNLSPEHAENFHKYVRGDIPIPKELEEAVKVWREIAGDIAGKASEFGITIKGKDGKRRPFKSRANYYPDFITEEFWDAVLADQNTYLKLLDAVSKQNNMTIEEARKMIEDMRRTKHSVYGHLEKPKIKNLPESITVDGKKIQVYERDPRKILDKYIRESYSRLGDAKEFGGDNQELSKLYEKAMVDGENFEEIQRLTSRMLGQEQFDSTMEQVSSWARSYNVLTKLSLAAVTNIGDVTKAFVRTNGYSGFRGTLDAFTKGGKDFAAQVGVTKAEIERYAEEVGLTMGSLSKQLYEKSGFEKSEEIVRRVAVNSAKRYVDMLHKKLKKNPDNDFAKRRLEQFGLDASDIAQRDLKKSDYVTAATQMIFDTQPVSRTDAPYYWAGPMGKMATQFKRFAHKQARFTKKFVLDELMKGNFTPAFWMFVLSQALGEPLGELKALIRGKDREGLINALQGDDGDKVFTAMFDNLMTIGGVGLATDALTLVTRGYGAVEGMLKFVVGPTVSDFFDYADAFSEDIETIATDREFQETGKKSQKGKVQPKIAKKLTYAIPFFGPALAAQLFPTSKSIGHKKKEQSKLFLP